jgi:hypothetical protein
VITRAAGSVGDEAALAAWVSEQVMNALREDVGERAIAQNAP